MAMIRLTRIHDRECSPEVLWVDPTLLLLAAVYINDDMESVVTLANGLTYRVDEAAADIVEGGQV